MNVKLTDKQTCWLANRGYKYSYDYDNNFLELSYQTKKNHFIRHCLDFTNNKFVYIDSTQVNKGNLSPKFLTMKEIKGMAEIIDYLNGAKD